MEHGEDLIMLLHPSLHDIADLRAGAFFHISTVWHGSMHASVAGREGAQLLCGFLSAHMLSSSV